MAEVTETSCSHLVRVTEGPLTDFAIHYNDVGEGFPVVLLHGSGPGASSWSNFNRNVPGLVSAGYRLLMIDLPGWSKSDPVVIREGARAVHNAAAVKGVLDHLGIPQAHIVGNSMGGASALQFALSYPDRLAKLVTMGAGAGGPSLFVPMPTEGIKLLMGLYREPTLENLRRMLQVFVYDPSALTEDLVQARLHNIEAHRHHLENFVESMRVNPRHLMADLSARMPEIKAPTLVTWGRDDRFVPLNSGLRLLWTIPDARMHVFSQCGHWAQWEKTEEFNRLLAAFF